MPAPLLDTSTERVDVELTETICDLVAALFTADVAVAAKAVDANTPYAVAVSLSLYGDNARIGQRQYGLQLRTRGGTDPRDVDDMAEAVHQVLHGRSNIPAGNSVIAHCWRISAVSLGRDESRRWQRSDNYLMDVSTVGTEWIET